MYDKVSKGLFLLSPSAVAAAARCRVVSFFAASAHNLTNHQMNV
jgi:hypothetical protein